MIKFIFVLILFVFESESAKILGVFPTPSISHQVVFRPLMVELAKRGHEVTVITTDPAFPKGLTPVNFTEIDVHDISYNYIKSKAKEITEKDQLKLIKLICKSTLDLVEMQLKFPDVQAYLEKREKIDLIFVELVLRPALILSHIYDAPVIEFSSLGGLLSTFDEFGAPTHPIYYPLALDQKIYNLTLWEKLFNLYINYEIDCYYKKCMHYENKVLRQLYGSNVPSVEDLRRNVQMIFLNVHPIWDFNRPVPSNIVYVGGLHQKPEKELPQDLKSYLESSTNGVIYISFGTNVKPSVFPPHILKMFTNVIGKLPYDIIWKWDDDELPGRPNNVRISKWLPQSDLLRHPKIKLFITQGGLQSTDEAISAGVPLVGLPFLGDQWFNVEQYVKLRIGKGLLLETITEKQLMDSITTVINDESYRKNIVKLCSVMNDQPQSSLERAVWWTEHVLRHGGGTHLRASAAHVDWTEYYELDLVLMCLAIVVVTFVVAVLLLYIIISHVKYYMRFKVKIN